MTSILDMKSGPPDYWAEITNFFLPLKYLMENEHIDEVIRNMDFNYLMNAMFWIFVIFAGSFMCFLKISEIFLKTFIKFYVRKQFARSIWNIAFYGASTLFLYLYNEFMLLPQLSKNQGRFSLFYSSDNLIFHQSDQCEKFQFYSLFIICFYLHAAILEFQESDILEGTAKILYLLALIALDMCEYETYFVGLNISIGIYSMLTEFFYIIALTTSNRNILLFQILLACRIASWSHIFISLLPFKYLVPTLFSKKFKIGLNIAIWLWYGISIWNSPVLQYFYHQIYHNTPQDCAGEGSAAKCILLKDSSDQRHFKMLKKAYLEMKLEEEKQHASTMTTSTSENSSAKAFQALKCIMTLKRKLKRIREGRGSFAEYDTVDDTNTEE